LFVHGTCQATRKVKLKLLEKLDEEMEDLSADELTDSRRGSR
jgi:hypothetical protein